MKKYFVRYETLERVGVNAYIRTPIADIVEISKEITNVTTEEIQKALCRMYPDYESLELEIKYIKVWQ